MSAPRPTFRMTVKDDRGNNAFTWDGPAADESEAGAKALRAAEAAWRLTIGTDPKGSLGACEGLPVRDHGRVTWTAWHPLMKRIAPAAVRPGEAAQAAMALMSADPGICDLEAPTAAEPSLSLTPWHALSDPHYMMGASATAAGAHAATLEALACIAFAIGMDAFWQERDSYAAEVDTRPSSLPSATLAAAASAACRRNDREGLAMAFALLERIGCGAVARAHPLHPGATAR